MSIESLQILSLQQLIKKCTQIEQTNHAPFSILIHGDFNANNIVFNPEQNRIRYIDFYRSKNFDYIQDASVFLVSNFRMPVFDSLIRQRLNWVIGRFLEFARFFAKNQKDDTFDLRMALALARSFYTSTRFELNENFATEMYRRSLYMMEKIADYQGDWKEFWFPKEILFY